MKTEKKFKYNGYHHFELLARHGEINNEPSLTIQDDSYTIKEIMEKFTVSGKPDIGLFQDHEGELNHDALDLRQVTNMDLVDRDELMTHFVNRQNEAKAKLEKLRAEAEQKEADEENRRELEAEIKRQKESDKQSAKRSQSRKFEAEKDSDDESAE